MRYLRRLAFVLGLVTVLAVPATAGAQTVVTSGMTRLGGDPTTAPVRMSDLAFLGNIAYAGTYSGFKIYDFTNPAAPARLATVQCGATPGGATQGDVSVWRAGGRTLLFRSVDSPQSKPECDRVPQSPGWEGIDIFDVTNPSAPVWLKGVATDCGSHTHTLVPDTANGRVLLYVSSYPASAITSTPTAYGNTCERITSTGGQGHDKISIVEVPLSAPQNASVIAEPQLSLDGNFTGVAGFKGCHDITVFVELKIAAGACLTEGVILDISNPVAPTIKNRLVNPAIDSCSKVTLPAGAQLCLWHSATFTWDGRYVVFGDEAGGGGGSECAANDPATKGAFWVHRVSSPTSPIASFKIPRPQTANNSSYENCTAHIMNFVPINGRYVLPTSWYSGGTSVVDWSNPSSPQEIAYFDVEPRATGAGIPDNTDPAQTNTWTTYWYRDLMFTMDGGNTPGTAGTANGGQRGFEIFGLDQPWRTQAWNLARFNPQTQENLMRCRVMSHGDRIRAKRRTMVHVQVRVLGQAVVRTRVNVRASGVRMSKMTNAQGEAVFMVRPARRGTLRVVVPNALNMLGCQTTRRIAAAPAAGGAAGGGGPALTGRPA
jgi:hypothetical protein